jgi:RNA polymerase sigma-70 factor (ECF subfamily)
MIFSLVRFGRRHIGAASFVMSYDGAPTQDVTGRNMTDDTLSQRFEEQRPRLHGVAQRLLGSPHEADDAVQETWLRLSRTDASGIDNLPGWLTTVIGRVCLDVLRSRASRRENVLDPFELDPARVEDGTARPIDPVEESLLAESVGQALQVVLDALTPAERIAFVLHDVFALSFEEIGPVVGRTPTATRQLASRARRRVQADPARDERPTQKRVVDAFFAAARNGRFDELLTLLDPSVVLRADAAAAAIGGGRVPRGAEAVAGYFSGRAQGVRPALIDGAVGGLVVPFEGARIAITFIVADDRILAIEVVADADQLATMDIVVTG